MKTPNEQEQLDLENRIELLIDIQRAVNAPKIISKEWVRIFSDGKDGVSIYLDFFSGNHVYFLVYTINEREIEKSLFEDENPRLTTHDLNVVEHYLEALKDEKLVNNDKIIEAIRRFKTTPKGKLFEIFGANKGSLRF